MLRGALVLLAGCAADDEVAIGPIRVATSLHAPAVPVVTFDAGGRAAAVEVVRDGRVERVVPASIRDGVATAAVVGLGAGEDHLLVPVVDGARGEGTAHTAPLAPEVMAAALEASEPGAELGGSYVMAAVVDLGASGVGVWDGAGRLVWWVLVDEDWTAASPRPSRDGGGVVFAINDRLRDSSDQQLVYVAWDGSARTERATPLAHHMVAELDAGEVAWLAWATRDVVWEGGTASVLADEVRVGDGVGGGETVLSFFDDRGPPFVPCSHGLLLDERLGVEVYEWTHANSLVWVPERDQLIVGARLLDAALAIDRRTGEVAWQLGGVQATLALADPETASSHAHFSEAWDGGLLVYDNGSHREPRVSRIVEYAVDEDAGVAEAVWVHDDLDGRFVAFLGDARRLPGGDVLIASGEAGTIDEVTRAGQRVWRMALPPGVVIGRIWPLARFP
jgi:hypothetical protein